MLLPYVNLVTGLGVFYFGVKVLIPEHEKTDTVSSAARFWRVVRVASVVNVILSLDSAVATAAAADGNAVLMAIGLSITVPATIVGAALVDSLLNFVPAAAWAGSGALGWIAGETIASDPSIKCHLTAAHAHGVALFAAALCAVLVPGLGLAWRRTNCGLPL
jgi:predicted tellurium resistance membrane protein TerC